MTGSTMTVVSDAAGQLLAGADPTLFGVLSRGCQEIAPTDSAVFMDNVKQGFQQGLSDPGVVH
jgi:hypothetical protein